MGDVLEPVRAVILEPEITFAPKLIAYEPTDADPAGLCQGLAARGHVDPVAKDVVVVVDYALADGAALPDKPSLAVLPFQNMSSDAEQEYFVDGMVEEITTAIAGCRGSS